MASLNKLKKLKNSHFVRGVLKNSSLKLKGLFYTASDRKKNKKIED
jgi:hypothetical protein